MKALITGASSGIGKEMAYVLATMKVDLILVARRAERLQKLKEELSVNVTIIRADVSDVQVCKALYQRVKKEAIDILINNAGFGDFGSFNKTSLDKDIQMLHTNIQAVHILTKLFLKDFIKRDSGYILNVASSAAFLPGPFMATYYATKSYVLRLSMAVYKELKVRKSNVAISVLCPGPVQTEFAQVANVDFMMKGKTSQVIANDAIYGMFQKQLLIIPGLLMKVSYVLSRILPNAILMECSYHIQHWKHPK